MKTAAFLSFVALLGAVASAEDAEALFDRRLKAGYEPAAVIEDSTSPDGKVAVLFTARKKDLKPADWPSVIPGVAVSSTDVQGAEEDYTTENWIVSLDEKKRLGVVRSKQQHFMAYHGGMNHRYFSALWGPEQEGWYYGLLNYSGRWGCTDIFMVNCDGTEAKLTSLHALFERMARKSIVAQGKDPEHMEIGYELLGVVDPASSVVVSDPITVRVGFTGQVPKSDEDADFAEGTMTVKIERDQKGLATATVLSVKAGGADAAPALDFAAFRKEWNDKSKEWKSVRKNLPRPGEGRTAFVQGWVESNVLQRLMHVDSTDDKNRTITLYYWREGQLTSVFELRTGDHTEISEVGEATNTYNFVNEKLVSWSSTGVSDSHGDGSDPGMQEIGEQVLKQSIKLAEPIYTAIGAD